MDDQLVVFRLATDHYGVGISAVESIIKMQPITEVPLAQQFVEGVINLRGKVVPVIDLRKRFGLGCEQVGKDTRVIVVNAGGVTIGMVVDEVSEVLRVDQGAVEPPSPVVATAESAFVRGIAKVDERLIILLDLGRILTEEQRADLEQIPAAV
ncbi:MAG TPA: chemotaxis protein CheW [Chloroflexota bacterium]|nr:chemotaxis protein CheW [Chloroflexota bacterium]